jgi:very-short-patch-repair endonuclease
LIVEIDGGIHESQKNLDHQRQQLLESLGLRFLRVSSEQVETNIAGVLALIRSIWNHPHP